MVVDTVPVTHPVRSAVELIRAETDSAECVRVTAAVSVDSTPALQGHSAARTAVPESATAVLEHKDPRWVTTTSVRSEADSAIGHSTNHSTNWTRLMIKVNCPLSE